jgi:hypothetical protein
MGEMADILLEQMMDNFDEVWGGSDELVWQTKDGELIPVSKMKDTHITNCVNLLKRRIEDANFWIASFEDELKEREMDKPRKKSK